MLSKFVHIVNVLTLPAVFLILFSTSSISSATSLRAYTHDNQHVSHDISEEEPPKLTDCLLSAVSGDDCGTVVAGCIWCKEPVYGLCLTESAAERVRWMPFFKCNLPEEKMKEEEEEIEVVVDEEVEIA
ncbi:hypothetical protein HJC23_004470 [Cyclotella cryptica]|uniref:Uncharacterized protein n=1 Tax=Cyclotella cryptica TaxID=29204 RepID=A0ABD3QG30_9STRA|eukprot:CCRYP_006086-RA/>CCRYP_006086-RA protein AED:0.29 eAED:0.29 QI:0/-1/0/1/-1/1/1/0/128